MCEASPVASNVHLLASSHIIFFVFFLMFVLLGTYLLSVAVVDVEV